MGCSCNNKRHGVVEDCVPCTRDLWVTCMLNESGVLSKFLCSAENHGIALGQEPILALYPWISWCAACAMVSVIVCAMDFIAFYNGML